MEVKNFWLNDKNIFTEEVMNELDKYCLDYLVIRENNYNEIHFGECIIRLCDNDYVERLGNSIEFDKKMKEIEEACEADNPENDFYNQRIRILHARARFVNEK